MFQYVRFGKFEFLKENVQLPNTIKTKLGFLNKLDHKWFSLLILTNQAYYQPIILCTYPLSQKVTFLLCE